MLKESSIPGQSVWTVSAERATNPIAQQVKTKLIVQGLPGAEMFAKAIVGKLDSFTFKDLPDTLTHDRICEALLGLVVLRIGQVRFQKAPLPSLHKKEVRYPAFMFPLLRAIGDIKDLDDAIDLEVECDPALTASYDSAAWSRVDSTLKDIVNYGMKNGMEIAYALPKETSGSVGVLSFVEADNSLKSHTSMKNPGDALMRAAFAAQFADYVWGTPRWDYNSIQWYQSQLERVVHDAFRHV